MYGTSFPIFKHGVKFITHFLNRENQKYLFKHLKCLKSAFYSSACTLNCARNESVYIYICKHPKFSEILFNEVEKYI